MVWICRSTFLNLLIISCFVVILIFSFEKPKFYEHLFCFGNNFKKKDNHICEKSFLKFINIIQNLNVQAFHYIYIPIFF